MNQRKYQSVAYLVRGHWAINKKKYEKSAEYLKEEMIVKSKKVFELWFIFSDYYPERTSNISWEDELNLPSLVASSRRYDSDVISAVDDMDRQNQWRKNTTTALGISNALNEYIEYSVNGKTKKESKIGFWRTCKAETVGDGKMLIPYIIKPSSKEYDFYVESFKITPGKTLFTMFFETEALDNTEVFVADEIKEIRNAKIKADGSYSLYDKKGQKAKLIKKSLLQDELESEELEKLKQSVRDIERKITNSGSARRAAGHISTSPVSSRNRDTLNYQDNTSSYNRYSSNNHNDAHSQPPSTESGGGWVIYLIIIIIVIIVLFAHR